MSHAPARILIVDDEPVQTLILQRWLASKGHTDLCLAANGEEALTQLENQNFDLVLCDVMMPKMDGKAFLQILQDREMLAHLPVIMVSGVTETDMAIDCIKAGAEDYIQKPVNTTLLESRISSVLEKKWLRDATKEALDRMEAELEGARSRQVSILPDPLSREGAFDAYGRMKAARAIGGDFYDYFLRDPDTLYLAIGDVAGKGPEAALFMTQVVRLIRMVAKRWTVDGGAPSPAAVVRILNEELTQTGETMQFVTLHLCRITLSTGEVTFCDAGHGLVWRLRDGGSVEPIELIGGPPIGAAKDVDFDEGRYELEPRDSVMFTTDGVTDAADEHGNMFGQDRLLRMLGALQSLAPEAVVGAVFATVNGFLDGAESGDDITALAFRRTNSTDEVRA